jgi:zinc/manganese transport system substrate-binding protein
MRLPIVISAFALAAAFAAPGRAAAAMNVVTTTEGLAALARAVGGDRVRVESLSRGVQDPHFVDANPMLAVKLRNADLLVDVGLDLEIGWLPPLVNQSRNGEIQPNGPRRLTAANAIPVLDVPTGPVDRSMGDLHPAGNPHFLTDPRRALQVAGAIAARLGQLDPGGKATYDKQLAAFTKEMQGDMGRWQQTLEAVKGKKVFDRHRTLTYFYDWSGVVDDGELEPKPGVPPPPSRIVEMVDRARQDGVKVILVENYYDTKVADIVAQHSGAKVVLIPGDVGGEPGAKDYPSYLNMLVTRVTGALK